MRRIGLKVAARARSNSYVRHVGRVITKPYTFIADTREVARYNTWLKLQKSAYTPAALKYSPLFSVVVPIYDTPPQYFKEMITSVMNQLYENWELILVDDASPRISLSELMVRSSIQDPRIIQKTLSKNVGIAGATNEAIGMAKGEFVVLFDHDDVMDPEALYCVAEALNANRELDFIYTDEDKINEDSTQRYQPFFKPDWNPDFLHSVNYITHLAVIRKNILDQVGYEDGNYNGAQDWELFLRLGRSVPSERIHHIPRILYSWRVHNNSTAKSLDAKPYVVESQHKAILTDLKLRGYRNVSVSRDRIYSGQWVTAYKHNGKPSVSVIVDSNESRDYVLKYTDYSNIAVHVSSAELSNRVLYEYAKSDYVVFAHGELDFKDASWLHTLLADASRKEIGFVVAKTKNVSLATVNYVHMVDPMAAELITKMGRRSLTRHLLATARYNLKDFNEGFAIIQSVKLLKLINKTDDSFSFSECSKSACSSGLMNLYNPYIKVLK